MKSNLFRAALLAAVLCTISGCYYEGVTAGSSKTATLRIYLNDVNSRALATSNTVGQTQSYAVTITGGSNPPAPASFNLNEQIVFSNVYIANNYTVTVTAHSVTKQNQSAVTVLGSGSTTFNVTDSLVQVSVIVPVGTVTPTTGRGTVNLLIQYPVSQNIQSVAATLTGASSVSATVTPTTGTATYNAAIISTPAIQSGQYTMQLVFDRGSGKSKTAINEAVMVYDNAITNSWIVDSLNRYDSVRVYDGIFTSTYSYLSNVLFSTTSQTPVPVTDPSFIAMNGFVASKLTDSTNYVVYVNTPQFQFMPISGQNGQTVSYFWSTSGGTPVWTTIDTTNTAVNPPSIPSANGTLQINVTAPDMVTQSIYTITVIATYTVTYSANGATSGTPPAPVVYRSGDIPQVLGNTGNLQKTNVTFSGWNTQADGSGLTYFPGNTLPAMTGNVTLYAKWIASSLSFSVVTVNPLTATILLNIPSLIPTISKKNNPEQGQLTVNLIQSGITYLTGATQWSYTTGILTTPVIIPPASNGAANKDTGLVWSPGASLTNGDYIFTVQATVVNNGTNVVCTGYFKVTVVN